jgi:hypothetical protein
MCGYSDRSGKFLLHQPRGKVSIAGYIVNTAPLACDKETMMEKRIEQFEYEGKKFIYYDVSHFKNNAQFRDFIARAEIAIRRYPADGSLYSVTNIEGVLYDTETKIIAAGWTDFNRPYIRQGAVIGADSTKRIMVNAVLKMSGRSGMKFFRTRDEAVPWLAAQ